MRSPIQDFLNDIHKRLARVRDGQVANSSKKLASAKPQWFGIALMTMDGHLYEVGDTRRRFTMQSMAKPFTYALALEDHGRDFVLTKIKVEPSGDTFSAITLDPKDGRPANPMINAGALAATGLVKGKSATEKLRRILAFYSVFAGRKLSIHDKTHHAIGPGSHRSRAIFHLLRDFGILEDESPDATVDAYFEQCAIEMDCRDLAQMAATLANHGINPVTGKRALADRHVTDVLAVMGSCGMYDHAGEWMFRVGMPAKSGVGGGIIAVLPGQLSVAVYSPPLDEKGNSVRAVKVCEELSDAFGLHVLRAPNATMSVIRRDYAHGDIAQVLELQGDINFTSGERVARRLEALSKADQFVIIDLSHCLRIDAAGYTLLLKCCRGYREDGRTLMFCGATHLADWESHFERGLGKFPHKVVIRERLAEALDFAEKRLRKSPKKPR